MRKPFFSVVVPTYNRAAKLRTAIDSVISQSFPDFEVLIMDDGSQDGTEQMIRSIADSRIRYEWAPNSGGPATPRNRGIERAAAPWISFLDADDIWYPNRLEEVAKAIACHPKSDVFCHDEIEHVIELGEKKILRHGPYEADFYRVMLQKGNRVSTSAVTVRMDVVAKHSLRFNQAKDYVGVEDYDFWLRLANYGCHFVFISQPLGEYIIETDNISHASERMRHNEGVLLHDHAYGVQDFEPDKDKLWHELRSRQRIEEAYEAISRNEMLNGVRALLASTMPDPLLALRILATKVQSRLRRARK